MKGVRLLTGGCRLAGVDVANNDDVDMSLFLTTNRDIVSFEYQEWMTSPRQDVLPCCTSLS